MFKNMSLGKKLIISFLVVGLLPFIISGFFSVKQAGDELESLTKDNLLSVRNTKKTQINNYFNNVKKELQVLSESNDVVNSLKDFIRYHEEMEISATGKYDMSGTGEELTKSYNEIYSEANDLLKKYPDYFGYYDIFLICSKHGHVMYSWAQEKDLGTNLSSGEYRNSHLATDIWNHARKDDEIHLSDFKPYAPSNGEPAMFAGTRVEDETGEPLGIVVIQISPDSINEIMTERSGMGETGESYLVGEDFRMRSNSFLQPEKRSIEASFKGNVENNGAKTEVVEKALAGKSGIEETIDYNGHEVISAYDRIEFEDFNWAIISEKEKSEALGAVIDMEIVMLIIGLIGLIAIVTFAVFLSKKITKPIYYMLENLGTEDINEASMQIAQSGQTLAEATTEQASSMQEISSNLEETTSLINTTTDNVKEASNLSTQAKDAAEEGNERMQNMLKAMQDIKESSDDIDRIIKTIDDIAFKTNILALNAAVEAARAGEAGSGFAVVAEEVRNLAAQSAKAAKNTGEIIEKSVSRSDRGLKLAKSVDESLEKIKVQSEQVNSIMDEISVASEEQGKGVEEINIAISEMENAIGNISASSEESAATSEELSAQVDNLDQLAKQLERSVKGAK
ncbi:MAG: methyl-accepting chemotaxis protein, partial [Fusobacteriota bacterium]